MGLLGFTFFNPFIDYLIIGGLLSFPLMMLGDAYPNVLPNRTETMLGIFLVVNGAHFAASTVRLYTKEGVAKANPIASIYAPLVCIALLAWALHSKSVNDNITKVYLMWSPYHYAAQTFGLASIYAFKSGCKLIPPERRYLWWICMLPFMAAIFSPRTGIFWFTPERFVDNSFIGEATVFFILKTLNVLMLLLPTILFFSIRKRGENFPLIALVLLATNAIWWMYLDYRQAWWWAALFHSFQYLFIVLRFHIDENFSEVTKREERNIAAMRFYLISLFGAFLLFFALPEVLSRLGFELVTAYLLVAYLVNIHHFFVDGFIWKKRKPKAA